LAAAGALALHGQPDLEQKWTFMAPEFATRLENREAYIDPAELLHLMNDDYIDLIIYDVRDERDWNIFHLVDAERVALEDLSAQRKRLRGLSELAVVVVVSNDEIRATQAWKRLIALAKPNAYILEGGINHWLNIYGAHEEEHESHGAASLSKPDGTLRHPFKLALGARHAAAQPDEHHTPERTYTTKVKLLKKVARAGGCD
jgi:rhodanese-related sulfurtransferase